jgi:hypothetical protein
MLSRRRITLLDPKSWDDQNDAYYLELYREKEQLASVLALCFTQASETYHHWRVFANGASGVCVQFKRAALLEAIQAEPGIKARRVKYLKLGEIRDRRIRATQLPFLKRFPFENEDEFRLIYESKNKRSATLDVSVPLACIERVTLSPWMHPQIADSVKRAIHGIRGCRALKVYRSTLIGNAEWKKLGDAAT